MIMCILGITVEGKPVLGGSFQMADTLGVPLWYSLDEAQKRGCVISFPHYFASAIEHGWTDDQVFKAIHEALVDRGDTNDFEHIKLGCIAMFMRVAHAQPDKPAHEIGRIMREQLEPNRT